MILVWFCRYLDTDDPSTYSDSEQQDENRPNTANTGLCWLDSLGRWFPPRSLGWLPKELVRHQCLVFDIKIVICFLDLQATLPTKTGGSTLDCGHCLAIPITWVKSYFGLVSIFLHPQVSIAFRNMPVSYHHSLLLGCWPAYLEYPYWRGRHPNDGEAILISKLMSVGQANWSLSYGS